MGVPRHTNPIDHYIKIMNKESIILNYLVREEDYDEEQIKK